MCMQNVAVDLSDGVDVSFSGQCGQGMLGRALRNPLLKCEQASCQHGRTVSAVTHRVHVTCLFWGPADGNSAGGRFLFMYLQIWKGILAFTVHVADLYVLVALLGRCTLNTGKACCFWELRLSSSEG
jgi:hypothetical protein